MANERAEGFGVCCKAKDTAPEFTVVWGEGGVYLSRSLWVRRVSLSATSQSVNSTLFLQDGGFEVSLRPY